MTSLATRLVCLTLIASLFLPSFFSCSETPPFENGKTAYEIAVENGFVGSEEDWLARLQTALPTAIVDVFVSNGEVTVIYGDGSALNLGRLPTESENSLSFLLLPDDTYAVVSCSSYATGNLIVPERFGGKQVTRILKGAFKNCDRIFSLELPQSLVSISEAALQGCSNLVSLTIPFVGASPNDTAHTHFGYLFGAKDHTKQTNALPASLESITVTGGTTLSPSAFAGCSSIRTLSLPNTLTTIGFGALSGCTSLTELTLPFVGESRDNNEYAYFAYIFGAQAPEETTYLPQNLNKVTLSDTEALSPYAFYHCLSLKSLILPENLSFIGAYAFSACRLESVTFAVTNGWQTADGTPLTLGEDSVSNARLLRETYQTVAWQRIG